MSNLFRIHGDNIVECERIASLILQETNPTNVTTRLVSPSTLSIEIDFRYAGKNFSWTLELLPGFNKSGRRRWSHNIFDALIFGEKFYPLNMFRPIQNNLLEAVGINPWPRVVQRIIKISVGIEADKSVDAGAR